MLLSENTNNGDNDTPKHMRDPDKDTTHKDRQRKPLENMVLGSLFPPKNSGHVEGIG